MRLKRSRRSPKIWPYKSGRGTGDLARDLAKKNVCVVLAKVLVGIATLARETVFMCVFV